MKRKTLLTSILAIVMSLSMIAGATFALFTSESNVNVLVTSGNVNVTATVEEGSITTYSFDKVISEDVSLGNFENGGTAEFTAADTLTVSKVTPGDKLDFTIDVENESDVKIAYRIKMVVSGDLKSVLVGSAHINGVDMPVVNTLTDWTYIDEYATIDDITVTIEFPENGAADNAYQGKDADIVFSITAVQANGADMFVVNRLNDLIDNTASGEPINLDSNVNLTNDANPIQIDDNQNVTIDLNGFDFNATSVNGDYSIVNKGTLTIKDSGAQNGASTFSTFASTEKGVIRGAGIKNEGTLIIDGVSIYAVDGPAIVNSGKMEITDAVVNSTSTNAIRNAGDTTVTGGVYESEKSYAINNESADGVVTVTDITTKGGIFNAGELTVNDSKIVNPHSGKHGLYNSGTATLNGSDFESTSGNELVHSTKADGVTINGGTFKMIGKSYLFSANIVVNDGEFYGYVNENGTNDKMRSGVKVYGGTWNFDVSSWLVADNNLIVIPTDEMFMVIKGEKVADGLFKNADTNEYYITDADGLIAFRDLCANNANLRNATIMLTSDIDMEGRTWVGVDAHYELTCKLGGMVFDGDGHTISNMNISGKAMFHRVVAIDVVTFKNLTMDNIVAYDEPIYGGNQFKAVFVGQLYSDIVFDNVTISNTEISGYWGIGSFVGIAGQESSIDILFNNCHVKDFVINAPWNYYTSSFVGIVWDADTGADIVTFTGYNTISNFTVNAVSGTGNDTAGSIHTDVSTAENVTVSGYEVKFS